MEAIDIKISNDTFKVICLLQIHLQAVHNVTVTSDELISIALKYLCHEQTESTHHQRPPLHDLPQRAGYAFLSSSTLVGHI